MLVRVENFIVGDTLKAAQSQNLRAGWIKGSTVAGHAGDRICENAGTFPIVSYACD